MKEFFTYEQQIEKLKGDGLIISDENFAADELKIEGYYNLINGYSPTFKIDNRFVKGTTFEHIKALYDFDKSLRSIVYKYTSVIECHVKALIAHEFSRMHGVDEKTYLSPDSFSERATYADHVKRLIETCRDTITDALNKNSNKYRGYIDHNYRVHNHVPMWVLIRALSFGTTSIFYKSMKDDEKVVISDYYRLKPKQLVNMLDVVVQFRNIVAHGERTFCARLPKTRLSTTLNIANKLSIPKNENGENQYGRSDFLALLICCKYLLPPVDLASFINELDVVLDTLQKRQTPLMFSKIKTQMGLKTNSWTLLPKLKITDE